MGVKRSEAGQGERSGRYENPLYAISLNDTLAQKKAHISPRTVNNQQHKTKKAISRGLR